MKLKIFFILICISLLADCNLQFSQNITNTLGTNGQFRIKDAGTTYFSLTQSTGSVNIERSLNFPNVTNVIDTVSGVIRRGGLRFIHTMQNFNTPQYNTFIGINSGNFSIQSSLYGQNTGVGYTSLFSLTNGYQNSAFGGQSLYSNTTGYQNSAFGNQSLYFNTAGKYNSAFGYQSLYMNTTGNDNTAFGTYALFKNTTGNNNCGFGNYALNGSSIANMTGSNNCAFGVLAGNKISSGSNNVLIGYDAGGYFFEAVNNSVGIGSSCYLEGSNSIVIGSGSQVYGGNSIAIGTNIELYAPNYIRLGNTSITGASIQVPWGISSDRRLKSNIINSPLGLDFISKLRPVSYTRINDESGRSEYGFIAQEVDEVLKGSGQESSGIITVDSEGTYNLRYNDLLAPMVRSIQELKNENDELKEKLTGFEETQKLLLERLEKLESKNIETNLTEK